MKVSFLTIVKYVENLAIQHKDINTCFRWNVNEITGKFRSGVDLPVMLIDPVETQTQGYHTKTYHNNTSAFTILGKPNTKTGDLDKYEAQNEVLDFCQEICFDIEKRMIHDANQVDDMNGNRNWLYGMVDKNSFHFFKVGPVFTEGLYGYRCEFSMKNKVCSVVNSDKWEDIN